MFNTKLLVLGCSILVASSALARPSIDSTTICYLMSGKNKVKTKKPCILETGGGMGANLSIYTV